MQALAGERIEKAYGVADEEPAWAGAASDAAADRGGTGHVIASLGGGPGRPVVGGGRDRREDRARRGDGAVAGQAAVPFRPEDDPD
ncbi:MAG: hypothetical protein M3Q66_01890, partial [Chloroflexota bacterium]|nr:hypothetical protein [Chloroflexota bacterium]